MIPNVVGMPVATASARNRRIGSARTSGSGEVIEDSLASSNTPPPADRIAPTSRSTSSHSATRDATGAPDGVTWCSLRDVVKPTAPASSASRSSRSMASRSLSDGALRERPLTHHERAQRRVSDVHAGVDALRDSVEHVEVLAERLPFESHALCERGCRDVLGLLEVLDHQVALAVTRRRQCESAVAHHHAGDAVPARRRPERIPEDLGVEVRVTVDESGRHDVPVGVDLAGARRPRRVRRRQSARR